MSMGGTKRKRVKNGRSNNFVELVVVPRSGAYYLEVAVGNGEARLGCRWSSYNATLCQVAGFIDSSWSNTAEHQWLSTAGLVLNRKRQW